nr:MAG TPA: hypothetical protein [Caudoviricetes sp.]
MLRTKFSFLRNFLSANRTIIISYFIIRIIFRLV